MLVTADGIESFLAAPEGRYVAGRHFFIWCHDLGFTGSVLWGRPEERDTGDIVAVWRALHPRMHQFDVVTDGSRIESIDAAAFDVMVGYLRSQLPEYAKSIRRQAIIHPSGLPGAAIAGMLPAIGPNFHRWQIFSEPRAGFQWLERPDADAVCDEVTPIATRLSGKSPWRSLLGESLRGDPDAVSLATLAQQLGRSERSLQRDLRDAGTTFRAELEAARIELARALLVDTDLKIDAIARRVGCASSAHFATLFRRVAGEPPSSYRERHKSRR
jgi:AraC-like DNA-binding protein